MDDTTFQQAIDTVTASYRQECGLELHYIPRESSSEMTVNTSCSFCRLIQEDANGMSHCRSQREDAAQNAILDNTYQIFICHAGLLEWVVPVYLRNELAGFFFSGFACSGETGLSTILEEEGLYTRRYHIKPEDFQSAVHDLPLIPREKVYPYARLLLTLVQLNNLSKDENVRTKAKAGNAYDVIGFLAETEATKDLPSTHPLSFYISDNNLDSDALLLFWKTVETRAGDIFNCIIFGRTLEGHLAFDEIMQLAYNETTLTHVKTSAEMLFHIIILKYYSKDFFDTRFYQLTFNTINDLQNAESLEEVKSIMSNSYRKLYAFYNEGESSVPKSSVSKTIIKYLETNYSKNIKIEDVGKYLYMSPAYISRLFRAETNCTIKQTLINIRMKHAQDLLLNSSMPIKDIGYAVGYKNDLRGFYKIFFKHFGVTCTEMRKKHYYIP